mgnify:CR=1 FL=1
MKNFQPYEINHLSRQEAKKYICEFFYIMYDGSYRILIDNNYEEITRETIEKNFFRTVKDKTLIEWFFEKCSKITYMSDIEKTQKEENSEKKPKKEEKKQEKKPKKKAKKEETSDEEDPLDANIEIKKSIDEALNNFD